MNYWLHKKVPNAMQLGCTVKHKTPSSAKVMNEWSYNSDPPLCLRVIDR